MLWGGVFSEDLDKKVFEWTKSPDKFLYLEDIEYSLAHALSLGMKDFVRKVIPKKDEIFEKVLKAESFEDIHTAVEFVLIEYGDEAKNLRYGRSRNEEVITAMRLWLLRRTYDILNVILDIMEDIVLSAEKNFGKVIYGWTHLRRAQPILFSHLLLGYFFSLKRDIERIFDFVKRCDECPAGSGAISGSKINADIIKEILGFSKLSENSIDAVSRRDVISEFIFSISQIFITLSRISEDMIILSSDEFSIIKIPDRFCTGSSLMPHKKNPDVFEILRGKAGKIIGNLIGMMVVEKGLPMGYNRDLQEDKEKVFSTAFEALSLDVLKGIFSSLEVSEPVEDKRTLSVDFAEEISEREKIPYHEAHKTTGIMIREGKLPDISVQESLTRKTTPQSTNPNIVKEKISISKEILSSLRREVEERLKKFSTEIVWERLQKFSY